jgi:hypothetical protein
MRYTIWVNGTPTADIELRPDSTSEELLAALEKAGTLDNCDADEFDIDDYDTDESSDAPPGFLVLDQLGEEICLCWPAHLKPDFRPAPEPEVDPDDLDDLPGPANGAIFEGESHEIT